MTHDPAKRFDTPLSRREPGWLPALAVGPGFTNSLCYFHGLLPTTYKVVPN